MVIKNVSLDIVCGITSKLPDTGRPEIAFAGKSNVGKSSLINGLLNRKALARTSSQPGKTQTINFYNVNDFMYLVDLPGYGYAKVPETEKAKWGKMIERYLHTSQTLKAVFLLIDIRHDPSANDKLMYDWIVNNGYNPIIIATKLDKLKRSQVQKNIKAIKDGLKLRPGSKIIPFSAETKQGKDEIWALMDKYDEDGNVEATQRAVNDVNLDIEAGDFVAVLGHNGSGKSTLAKQINALLIPSEGTMWVDDMDTAKEPELWKIRQKAGMVFQNPDNQIIGTVVEEDVGFGPENMGVPTDEIWKRVDDSLKKTGMTAYRYQSPNKLSGGQKQRVAIAGVVAMRPSCIVLDEPTAMLDPNGRKEVLKAVSELNKKENVTVVLITHYMEEVIHANKVYVMDGGNVVMQGTPREIFSQVETLKKYRLDVPQVTLLAHELHKAGVDIPEGILTKEELVGALCR